ncbi:hydrogenase maturation protease [Legionella sp. PATHC035]|uniref:hydrogenase maturation protease n=1 Tax=Legionella sp. PATHC035 TaxID=2992040 RepID=UPI002243546B|nr:hydrogenase maturation protease [Legionella sp. PATHC035]MCW8408139.1 hydrogenase maturation protease [Legionella sp. PATHC035]
MKIIKVLGIGSPFGDDQVGWKVANALHQSLSKNPHLAPFLLIESHDRPGVRLIELMSGFNTVFIIDAVKSGSAIGTIHRFENESILDSESRFSTHGISILQTLHLARALNELPANLLFYGIEIDAITLDDTLSPPMERAIAEVTRRLINDLVTACEA